MIKITPTIYVPNYKRNEQYNYKQYKEQQPLQQNIYVEKTSTIDAVKASMAFAFGLICLAVGVLTRSKI